MFEITKIKSEEGSEAAAFILSQFEKFIFADYTEEGKASVRGYVTAESLVANDADNFAVVARLQGALVGVAKVKRKNHLSMLFVAAHCQGRGFGKQLVETSVAECKSRHPDVTHMTANSSRVGLPFFRSRGFRPTADEQEVHGVRFAPVTLELAARPRHPGAGVI